MSEKTDSRAKVFDILKSFSTAMVVSNAGGTGHARPMHVAQVEEEGGEVCFLTGHGGLAEDVQRDSAVLLVFQNDTSAYLSARGQARIEHNKERVKELWKAPYKVWFPKGPDDPEIALVTVRLQDAEYWDSRGMNKLEYLFEAAKAYATGQKPDLHDKDQHAKATI